MKTKIVKKVKIEERLENAMNAFFDAGDDKNATALVFADGSAAWQNAEHANFSEKAGFWTNSIRQVVLFLPGAFLLYFVTLSTVFFFPNFGLTFQMLFWLFFGGFLCLVGLGSLKNIKNLLIPFSIVLFSAAAAILFGLFPNNLQPMLYFGYSIYLFPLVLIGSKLLKDSIDDK